MSMFSSGLTVASFIDRNCDMRATISLVSIRTLKSQTIIVVKLIYFYKCDKFSTTTYPGVYYDFFFPTKKKKKKEEKKEI